MNKLNGWMRLWVLLSAPFWLAAIFFVVKDVPKPDESGERISYSAASGCNREKGDICDFVIDLDEEVVKSRRLEHSKKVKNNYESAFYLATIGPAIMFAFGYGIAWVRRGFKNTN